MSNMSKKKIIAMMALVIVIAILGTGTLAYFTTKAVVHNVITSGAVGITLKETMLDENGNEVTYENPEDNKMPGDSISKIVRVQNDDEPAWIRIRVTKLVNEKADAKNAITINYNLGTAPTQWTQKDGWFYYNKPLAKGESTDPLFKFVDFDGKKMDNDYQNATIEINVEAQAVQSANNGTKVLEATGWPNT